MKLLIIGGNGMAGHLLVRYFRQRSAYQVDYTTRDLSDQRGIFLDVTEKHMVRSVIQRVKPDVVINAVGVLNHMAEQNPVLAYEVNGLFPHRLQAIAEDRGAKLIHISTDCVFSGKSGQYDEAAIPDGESVYARSKALGEVRKEGHVTIRTSIIGPEIRSACIGLLHWFMQQQGSVKGYVRVPWNGVTTLELARAIEYVMHAKISGLIHLAHPEPISKCELLQHFQRALCKEDVNIVPDDHVVLDRTLRSTRADVCYELPSYETMLLQLVGWMKHEQG